jgi:hypothetical protein
MDHSAHMSGTVDECPDCRALAYEPGWYKALREERVVQRRPEIAVPDMYEPAVEIVMTEASDVTLPELEETVTPDDLAR